MSWHPCLLILGQNCNAKCQLLNILLGEKLLPTTKISSEENCKRRRIRFTHGTQTRVSLALPEQYELVHMMAAHRGQWDTIPEEDLEIRGDSEDPAHRIAELEVMLPYSLLKVTGCLCTIAVMNSLRRSKITSAISTGIFLVNGRETGSLMSF